jgi:hypothetical protein
MTPVVLERALSAAEVNNRGFRVDSWDPNRLLSLASHQPG